MIPSVMPEVFAKSNPFMKLNYVRHPLLGFMALAQIVNIFNCKSQGTGLQMKRKLIKTIENVHTDPGFTLYKVAAFLQEVDLADLPTFMASLRGYMAQTGHAFPQVLGTVLANLQSIHPQIRSAWVLFEQQAHAADWDPYAAINIDALQNLIANAIRQPNDLLDATARFMALRCDSLLALAAFIITFREHLSALRMLGAQFPDGPLLVTIFINMVPESIHPYLLSRNHSHVEEVLQDAATHARTLTTAAVAGPTPMDLGFIQEVEQRGVAAPVAAELLAIAQQRLGTSGGASASRSGGTSTKPSGGPPLPPSTDNGKNKADTLKAQLNSRMLPGGGANSGIPKSILSAGEGTDAKQAKWTLYETDNSKPLDQYAQSNLNSSIIGRSTDPEAWAKHGHLLFRTCNDGDLVEPMIGHSIQVMFDNQFWLHTTGKASDGRPLVGSYKGTILAVSLKKNLPQQVKNLVDVPNKKANGKHLHYIMEVLILQDPTVDGGTKPMHKNCLREAIMDTYPRARDNPNYTIQDLVNDTIEKDLYNGPEAPAARPRRRTETTPLDPARARSPRARVSNKPLTRTSVALGKAAEEADDGGPKKAKLNSYSTNYALKAGVQSLVETAPAFFGVSRSQPFY
jgi:hypothetical protein